MVKVNTPAAELLYNRVIEGIYSDQKAESSFANSCVLDICCGTGTIGICAMKANEGREANSAAMLLGVELCAAAVENAIRNAAINDISNFLSGCPGKSRAEFICSRAEDVLTALLRSSDCKWSEHGLVVDKEQEIDKVRDALVNKKLQAIVDPPREVNEQT